MPRAIIFTEGSAQWGMGHLYRCEAYSEELRSNGWEVEWRVCGDALAQKFLAGRDSHLNVWYEDPNLSIGLEGVKLAVIDSYYAPLSTYAIISDHVPTCIYIDDEARLNYPKGYVVNSAPNAESLSYSFGGETHFLSGPKFHPLRPDFRHEYNRQILPEIRNILILMGGADIRELTPMVAERARFSFPNSKIKAIVSNASQREKWAWLESSHTSILGNQSAKELCKLMEDADICISASGQTVFEICKMGLPAIGIVIADNQRHIMTGMSEARGLLNSGRWDAPDLTTRLAGCLESIKPMEMRIQLAKAGQSIVDGNGCQNVLLKIFDGHLTCSNQ